MSPETPLTRSNSPVTLFYWPESAWVRRSVLTPSNLWRLWTNARASSFASARPNRRGDISFLAPALACSLTGAGNRSSLDAVASQFAGLLESFEARRVRDLATRSELKAFRAQINSHFLVNQARQFLVTGANVHLAVAMVCPAQLVRR